MIRFDKVTRNTNRPASVEPVLDLSFLKDDDLVLIRLDDVKFELEHNKDLDMVADGKVVSAKLEGLNTPIYFGFPFVAVWKDIKPCFDKLKSDYYLFVDLAYHLSSARKLMVSANNWKADNTVLTRPDSKKEHKEFLRAWGEPEILPEDNIPSYPEKPASIDLVILTKNNGDIIYDKLDRYEAMFKHVVIVDDDSADNTKAEVDRYVRDNPDCKLTFSTRSLSGDFASQRNHASSLCVSEWVFQLDADEDLDEMLLNTLHRTAANCSIQNKMVAAFPRLNYLNGVLVNDVPRDKWDARHINSLKGSKDEPKGIVENYDWQARLHKKEVKWVRKVHEMPSSFFYGMSGLKREANRCLLVGDAFLIHPKTVLKQKSQDKLYDNILSSGDKNVMINSVMFTQEGITKHAREEAKQLQKLGWNIFITDFYKDGYGKEFKEMYKPFDTRFTNHITYINQPPMRQSRSHDLASWLGSSNIVYYLAWEGDCLPTPWKQVMMQPSVRKILTPSTYCKKVFEKEGLRNVEVLPHGIDVDTFKPSDVPVGKRIVPAGKNFLFVGTWFGNRKDRKGIDVLLDAWKKVNESVPEWNLVLKLNPVYFESEHWSHSVRNLIGGLPRVHLIDEDLSDEEMSSLYNSCDCYINPSRAEGFSLTSLEASACGLPIIATDATGHLDFLNKDNAKLIKVLRTVPAEERYPYKGNDWHCNWHEPSTNHLADLMIEVSKELEALKVKAINNSVLVREQYNWKVIGERLESVFKRVLTGN